jgi:glycosyltransferase involved in cell wall biosynthesis
MACDAPESREQIRVSVLKRLWPVRRMSQAGLEPAPPTFCIVTPVFNGATYIDDTIRSVLTQSGDFILHYHVQDGGSTDDTLPRVRRWMELSRRLPSACRKLVFTCASAPDAGMYDAVNKGFAHALPPGDDVMMAWVAADDRVAPGACATIASVRHRFPDICFVGGRISLLDEQGSIIGVHPLVPFSRRCMAAGLYDGRALSFIMQEGTFWSADLWRKVGGVDPAFKLAGDWDLWRRMAVHAQYVSVDGLLGFHRRRPGQLSEQMDRYYAEIDHSLDTAVPAAPSPVLAFENGGGDPVWMPRDTYQRVAAEHETIRRDPPRFRQSYHSATAVRYDLNLRRWDRIDGFGALPDAPRVVTIAGWADGHIVVPSTGFLAPEGPYPEFGLFSTIRWMCEPTAEGRLTIAEAGRYRVVLLCRSWARQNVLISVGGSALGRLPVDRCEHDRDFALAVEGFFGVGDHVVSIAVDHPSPSNHFLLVIDWRLERILDAADPIGEHEPASC